MREKLPSAFQPKEKVGLQTLINLLQSARDGDVVSVQFTDTKVKYNIAVPIVLSGEQHGFFRMANIDASFVHAPIQNEFHYNDQVAIIAREGAQAERIRDENRKAFAHVDMVLDASWHGINDMPFDGDDGYTDSVLIDIDGNRKTFTIGWHDNDDKVWRNIGDDEIDPTMKWQYLPLAKYDK